MPLIVLEGIDFAGKTTQSKRLAERLNGERQVFPDESTDVGRMIRSWLNHEWKVEIATDGSGYTREQLQRRAHIDATVFQCLQLLNRIERLEKLEEASGSRDRYLVCDRYWASGIVYGGQDGLSVSWLLNIHSFLPRAQVSILLDLSEEEVVTRMRARGRATDRYEKEGLGALLSRKTRYTELWKPMMEIEPHRWAVVDGHGTEDEVTDRLLQTVVGALAEQLQSSD